MGVLILPLVTSMSEDALSAVPNLLRDNSLRLLTVSESPEIEQFVHDEGIRVSVS